MTDDVYIKNMKIIRLFQTCLSQNINQEIGMDLENTKIIFSFIFVHCRVLLFLWFSAYLMER